jgi:hypothetical protein
LQTYKPWLTALVLCCTALPLIAAQPQKQAVFPHLTADNLNKEKVELPQGLAGQIDLLLISFEPEQQKDIDSWLPAAQAVQHTNFHFRYYELPVAGKENFIFRWWETSSMRSDQSDPVTWTWTVPLFIDRKQFQHELNIPNQKEIVVLLIDRQGHILWRTTGPVTPEKRTALMAATSGAQ